MTDEEFLIKLREAFAVEAGEHLQAMTSGLLELEKDPKALRRKEIIEFVFREAHSLKGAARAVSRTDIEAVCQALESIFSKWQLQPVGMAAETFDTLNRALDLVDKLLRLPDVAKTMAEKKAVTDMVRQLGELHDPPPAPESVPVKGRVCKSDEPSSPDSISSHLGNPAGPVPSDLPSEGPHLSETVRIPMAKMDSLLRQAEEMVAVKLITRQHAMDLRGLEDELGAWHKECAKVRDLARPILGDQSVAALTKLGDFLDWNQNHMRSFAKRLALLTGTAERDERGISTLVDGLLEDAKRLVMLPCSVLLDLLPKLVRDLARTVGKEADISLRGREVEIDKRILQEMKDPLIHLVRNSIDHGLEQPAGRAQAHKPSCGSLTVAVSQRDTGKVEIVISDDGRGIDLEMVKAAAIRNGTLSADDALQLDEQAALVHIFDSGVSTSPIITEISGRGLGMAIVREKVEKLGGQIAIETVPGTGTIFRIVLPVTLATFKGILVGAGGQSFVIPTTNVERIKRIRRDDIQTVENTETMSLDGHAMSFVRLHEVLELPPRVQAEQGGFIEVVVLGAGEKRIGFAVDEVFYEQEVLVKNIGKPLLRVRNVAGATVLGSGVPVVILNAADLLKSAVRLAVTGRRPAAGAPQAGDTPHALHILVTDDSVTSRMLLKNILESSGYQVTTAVDGVDALTALKSCDFDLVVSDVEMPRMDGFDLTAKIRADKKLAELPVVLVTALSSRAHQERGIDVGANAYIVKSSFDQSNLLEVIRKLV